MRSILLTLLLISAAHADIPNVTLSPDNIADSPAISADINKVVVYGDRAVVHRTTTKKLSSGIHTLRLPNLPSTIDQSSIRIDIQNASLLKMDTRLVDTAEYSIDEVNDLIAKMKSLDQEIERFIIRRKTLENERKILQNAVPASQKKKEYDDNIVQYNLQLWRQNWTFIGDKIDEVNKELQQVDISLEDKRMKLKRLQAEARPLLNHNTSKTSHEVVIVVELSRTSTVDLNLSYTVNGAGWVPTYDVHYNSETDQTRIESAALVLQNSGENWSNVKLELATSNRSVYQSLPNLLTWTLGEQNEYIPEARPANSRPNIPLYPPLTAKLSKADFDKMSERDLYETKRKELQHLSSFLQQRMTSVATNDIIVNNMLKEKEEIRVAEETVSNGFLFQMLGTNGQTDGGALSSNLSEPNVAYSAATEVDFSMDSALGEGAMVARSAPPRHGKKRSGRSLPPESATQVANTPLALEASNVYAPVRYYNNTFNISEAQGLNLLWEAPGTFTIPSDGQRHKVPLQSASFDATSFYETTPSLEEIAYLKGTVQNTSDLPILQGNANIFLNGHYTVQSHLKTTKAGGLLELPLGADENIRIKRNITPLQRKEGMLKQQDITDYAVTIEVGNYKQKDISIRIVDQIPITQMDEISIEFLEASHDYQQQKNHQGILYWDLEIPAGETETIELKYSIARPKDWKIWGK